MCHFITAVIPPEVAPDAAAALFAAHRLGFVVLQNPNVAAQLSDGERHILTTRGHCDCGTVLGSHREAANHERELEKLRKKGWGEAKIERWVEQKRAARVR